MPSITEQLANALRECRDHIRATERITGGNHKADEADEALADYDAKVAATPPGEVKSNRAWREECQQLRARLAAYEAPAKSCGPHTAEPWRASDYAQSNGESGACVMAGDDTVLDLPFGDSWSDDEQRANARRIVACVNACVGTTTEKLESGDYGIIRTRHASP